MMSKAYKQVIKLIDDEQEFEKWTKFCNTDCIQYRQGTCPYRWDEHNKCAKYIDVE